MVLHKRHGFCRAAEQAANLKVGVVGGDSRKPLQGRRFIVDRNHMQHIKFLSEGL